MSTNVGYEQILATTSAAMSSYYKNDYLFMTQGNLVYAPRLFLINSIFKTILNNKKENKSSMNDRKVLSYLNSVSMYAKGEIGLRWLGKELEISKKGEE